MKINHQSDRLRKESPVARFHFDVGVSNFSLLQKESSAKIFTTKINIYSFPGFNRRERSFLM